MQGQLLAQNGAVTLDGNTINNETCATDVDGENGDDDEEATDDEEEEGLPRTGGYPYFTLGLIALVGGTFILKKRK